MLEVHAAALVSDTVAYHEFLLVYKANVHAVYGMVEGREDPCFYRGLIDSILPDGWGVKLISVGSKKKVLKILEKMDWSRFPKKQVCFFVDRDLSEFLDGETHSAENLYVTDHYSIENHLVSEGVLDRVLDEILGVTRLGPEEKAGIWALFLSNLDLFRETLALVMAQIILWRRSSQQVCLDNIDPKEYFCFLDGRLSVKAEYASGMHRVAYAAECVRVPPAPCEELAAAESEFRTRQGPERFTRGKYILWFFVQSAKEIHRAIPTLCSGHKTPPRAHVEFGVGNAMLLVAPRVRCPASLRSFLESNFGEYIRGVGVAA